MGIRILYDTEEDVACFYNTSDEVVFGPAVHGSGQFTGKDVLTAWWVDDADVTDDPRDTPTGDLVREYDQWHSEVANSYGHIADETLHEILLTHEKRKRAAAL